MVQACMGGFLVALNFSIEKPCFHVKLAIKSYTSKYMIHYYMYTDVRASGVCVCGVRMCLVYVCGICGVCVVCGVCVCGVCVWGVWCMCVGLWCMFVV